MPNDKNDNDHGEIMVKTGNYPVHILKSHNDYKKWQTSIKLVLVTLGAQKMIENNYTIQSRDEIATYEKQKHGYPSDTIVSEMIIDDFITKEMQINVKAMMVIKQSVNSSVQTIIENCDDVKDMWSKIKTHYDNPDVYTQNFLKQEENSNDIRFQEDISKKVYFEKISDCLDRYAEKWAQMKHAGIEPTPNEKARRIQDMIWSVHHYKAQEIQEKLENEKIFTDSDINGLMRHIRNYDNNKLNIPPYHSLIQKKEKKSDVKTKEVNATTRKEGGANNKECCKICKNLGYNDTCVICKICNGHGHIVYYCGSNKRNRPNKDGQSSSFESRNNNNSERRNSYKNTGGSPRRDNNSGGVQRRTQNYRRGNSGYNSSRHDRARSNPETESNGYDSAGSINSVRSNDSHRSRDKRDDRGRSRSRSRSVSKNRFNKRRSESRREVNMLNTKEIKADESTRNNYFDVTGFE